MSRNERLFTVTIRTSCCALALGALICAFSAAAAGLRNAGGGLALGGTLSMPRATLGATANGAADASGLSATRISPRAEAVTNGADSVDADHGLDRAEDRMNAEAAAHSEAVEKAATSGATADVKVKAAVSPDPGK